MIYVDVPETSGLHVSTLSSPVVTLGCYRGLSSDSQAPQWTRMPPGISFEIRQPRKAIADVFMEIAFWPENVTTVRTLTSLCNHSITHMLIQRGLSPAMINWAEAISVSVIAKNDFWITTNNYNW